MSKGKSKCCCECKDGARPCLKKCSSHKTKRHLKLPQCTYVKTDSRQNVLLYKYDYIKPGYTVYAGGMHFQ